MFSINLKKHHILIYGTLTVITFWLAAILLINKKKKKRTLVIADIISVNCKTNYYIGKSLQKQDCKVNIKFNTSDGDIIETTTDTLLHNEDSIRSREEVLYLVTDPLDTILVKDTEISPKIIMISLFVFGFIAVGVTIYKYHHNDEVSYEDGVDIITTIGSLDYL